MKSLLTSFVKIVTIRKNSLLQSNSFKTASFANLHLLSPPQAPSMNPKKIDAPRKQNSHLSALSNSQSYQSAISSSATSSEPEPAIFSFPSGKRSGGSLLTLILPKEWQDFNINKDEKNRVDFATMKIPKICGDMHTNDSQNSELNSPFNFDTIVDVGAIDPADLIVSLDLCIWLKGEETRVHMNRDVSENSNRTLKRLELSADKKIASILSPFQKKGKGKASKKCKKGGTSLSSRLFTKEVSSDDKDGNFVISDINLEGYNAMELCKTLALRHELGNCTTVSVGLELRIPNKFVETEAETETIMSDSQSLKSDGVERLTCDVVSNPPMILSVSTFESFASKIFVRVPVVVQTTILHADRARVSWFLNDDLVLTDSHSFIPQKEDIGKSLRVVVTPCRKGYHGRCFPEAYKFENVVEDLPYMPIVSPLRDEYTASKRSREEEKSTLRMMTYNILADLYVSREVEDGSVTYPHVYQEHIVKKRRIPMVLAEILAHDSDVICLQEVDGAVYDSYLEPAFQAMGYDGYYSNKASCQREGCAMFWSREKFQIDEALTFSLREMFEDDDEVASNSKNQRWASMKGINYLLDSHKELRKVTIEKIGQVLQVAILKLQNCNEIQPEKIVVANTHLFYHPMADHIRAMQVYVVCKKVDEVRRKSAGTAAPYPFLLCGDLNSDPLSGAAQLLFNRILQPDHHDCWKHLHEYQWDMGSSEYMLEHEYIGNSVGSSDLKYEDEEFQNAVEDEDTLSKMPVPIIEFPESFPVLVSGCKEMPTFTNFAIDFVDTLDYILASQPRGNVELYGFSPKQSARMPTTEEVKQFVAMVSFSHFICK